jgi:multidrug efflux system outer membrane protein
MRQEDKHRFAEFWLALILVCAVTGCMVGEKYQPPAVALDMEDNWQAVSFGTEGQFDTQEQPMVSWWRQFQDKTLNGLVEQLVSSNLALAGARQRVVEISARQGIVRADKQLQLAAALGYTHAEVGDEAVSFQGLPAGLSKDLFAAGVVTSWELDLWGRTTRLVEAAGADIGAGYADYQGMMVSLAAELTLAYFNERTLEARLDMVRHNIALQEKTMELAQSRLQAGNGTALAVERTRRLLQSTRARLPELERAQAAAGNRINVLLGLSSGTKIIQPGSLPAVPQLIGIGLPADLLVRRPDIRRAFHLYHAAVARTGAAEAEKYPRLSLAGTFTLSSDTIGGIIDPDSLIYTLGPGLSFPLLTGGRIESTIKVRKSQSEQARLALEQTIVEALAEVENSAVGVMRSQEQVTALDSAELAAEKSVEMADALFQAGLGDFFQVLDNEQQLVAVQESLLLARQQALSDVVRLYRALGGGWESETPGNGNR